MQVEVLLFAAAREAAGSNSIQIDVSENATASDVLCELSRVIPGIAGLIPSCRLALDSAYVDGNASVSAANEIALIPPVSGG